MCDTELRKSQLTVCVSPACFLRGTGAGAGVDSAWEQRKLEAREMLDAKRAARREAAVPGVRCTLCWAAFIFYDFSIIISMKVLNKEGSKQ